MFKKILAVLTAAVLFTSCAFTETVNKKIDKAKEKVNEIKKEVSEKIEDDLTPTNIKLAKELGQNVLTAIQNEDVDALADLFCQYTVEEYGDDLKPEIQNLYDYIDGKIVSHDEIETRKAVGRTTEKDGVVVYTYCAIIENVITDKGNKYLISCKGYSVYKDHPELIGFVELYVEDTDKFEYIIDHDNSGYIDESMFSYHVGNMPEEYLI